MLTNWREQHLYGSSRLGMWRPNVNLASNNAATVFDTTGIKFFELNNHLGNVMVTVTDRRIQVPNTANTLVDHYEADVISAQDYSSFGAILEGRSFGAITPRGFNSQERSLEIDPHGNLNTAEYWEYDARIGRRWNTDPKPKAIQSPYSVLDNLPTFHVDFKGDTPSVHEAAQMAEDSYNLYKDRSKIDGGWIRIKELRGLQFVKEDIHYKSALYSRTVGGVTEYTYATAGTENMRDWLNNLDQPVGLSSQYDFSINQARRLINILPGNEITFTGHSLGGGKASLNSLATDRYAITFNAAGLSPVTKLRYDLTFHKANILAFIVPGEAVDTYQGIVGLKAEGTSRYVNSQYGEVNGLKLWLLRKMYLAPNRRIELHLMPAMFEALNRSGYGGGTTEPQNPNEIHGWSDFIRELNRWTQW